MDQRFEMLVDRHSYAGKPKPDRREMGRIRTRFASPDARVRIDIEQLEWAIRHGLTIMPGLCEGGTRGENWTGQQLWFVDVDNDREQNDRGYHALDPLDALDRAFNANLEPMFLYFTSKATVTPWNPRYRIVFALDHVETDRRRTRQIGDAFLRLFPEADQGSCQPERMFLCPGKEVWPTWRCQL